MVTRHPGQARVRTHDAVLTAATAVAEQRGYTGATIEEIAATARVAKQTIYRWWPNKAALFIEVYERLVPRDLFVEDTGSLAGDLEMLLVRLSERYAGTAAGTILAGLIAEAQADPALAAQLRDTYVVPRRAIYRKIFDRSAQRGEIAPDPNLDFSSDLMSGAIWFRLLLGERELDEAFRRQLVTTILSRQIWRGSTG
jgi:AcrR family transcriptional regulator